VVKILSAFMVKGAGVLNIPFHRLQLKSYARNLTIACVLTACHFMPQKIGRTPTILD